MLRWGHLWPTLNSWSWLCWGTWWTFFPDGFFPWILNTTVTFGCGMVTNSNWKTELFTPTSQSRSLAWAKTSRRTAVNLLQTRFSDRIEDDRIKSQKGDGSQDYALLTNPRLPLLPGFCIKVGQHLHNTDRKSVWSFSAFAVWKKMHDTPLLAGMCLCVRKHPVKNPFWSQSATVDFPVLSIKGHYSTDGCARPCVSLFLFLNLRIPDDPTAV